MNFTKRLTWAFAVMLLVCSCNNDLEELTMTNQPEGIVTKSTNGDV